MPLISRNTYDLDGWRVCLRGFCHWKGISKPRWSKFLSHARTGNANPPADLRFGRRGAGTRSSCQADSVSRYFAWLYKHVAETMPDDVREDPASSDEDLEIRKSQMQFDAFVAAEQQSDPFTCQWQEAGLSSAGGSLPKRWLPPGCLADQYRQYSAVCSHLGIRPAHWSTLWRTWQTEWKGILEFRRTGVHAKCDECEDFKRFLRDASTLEERSRHSVAWENHLRETFADRRVYYALKDQSSKFWHMDPDAVVLGGICCIIDGMDQAKFKCPRNLAGKKAFADMYRPTLHFSGCVIHGLVEQYWVSDADLKKDPNTEIETLSYCLDYVFQARSCRLQGAGCRWPAHLSVQADNCSREMRNQWTLLFGVLLVLLDVFQSVTFNFLQVGHTHEDIDQLFGTIATILSRQSELQHPKDFVEAVKNGLTRPRPDHRDVQVGRMQAARDWKSWLAGLGINLSGYTGRTAAHSVRILKRKRLMPCFLFFCISCQAHQA